MKEYCGYCDRDEEYNIVVRDVDEFDGVKLNNCKEKVALCKKCNSRIFIEELESENRKNILSAYRKALNLITPEELIEFRNKYYISQRELSSILGYAKMTINKYERGAIADKSHSSYLKIIINNDKEFLKITQDAYDQKRITEKTYNKVMNKDKELINDYKFYEMYKDIIFNQLNSKPNEYNGYSRINIDLVFNIISYIASKVNNLTITSLNKYLWYIDMLNYKNNGKSLTGLIYEKESYGPVIIKNLYRDISIASDKFERIDREDSYGNLSTKIISNNNFELSDLKDDEIKIINKVINTLKNKSVTEISELSHKEMGWKNTQKNEYISFKYADDLKLV